MSFKANTQAQCAGCGQTINIGDAINWPRRGPMTGQKYHSDCFDAIVTSASEKAEPIIDSRLQTMAPVVKPATCNECGQLLLADEYKAGVCNGCKPSQTVQPSVTPVQNAANDSLAAVMAGYIQPFITVQTKEIQQEMDDLQSDMAHSLRTMRDSLDATVETKVLDAMATLKPEVHTIIVDTTGKELARVETSQHKLFPLLMQLIAIRQPTYLWGEAGSGKSSAAHVAATALNLPYYYLALQAQTVESKLMGYMDANGKYVETDFYRAYTGGGVFLLDELELGNGNLLGSLNGALANGKASFPCGTLDRHPDFVCIATGNTPALGATPAYSDRRALDGSVRDRFAFVEWNTDEDFEMILAKQEYVRAEVWVKWVQAIRRNARSVSPRLLATQRASVAGAKMLHAGLDASFVAHSLVFRGFDSNSVKSLLAGNPLPTFN